MRTTCDTYTKRVYFSLCLSQFQHTKTAIATITTPIRRRWKKSNERSRCLWIYIFQWQKSLWKFFVNLRTYSFVLFAFFLSTKRLNRKRNAFSDDCINSTYSYMFAERKWINFGHVHCWTRTLCRIVDSIKEQNRKINIYFSCKLHSSLFCLPLRKQDGKKRRCFASVSKNPTFILHSIVRPKGNTNI